MVIIVVGTDFSHFVRCWLTLVWIFFNFFFSPCLHHKILHISLVLSRSDPSSASFFSVKSHPGRRMAAGAPPAAGATAGWPRWIKYISAWQTWLLSFRIFFGTTWYSNTSSSYTQTTNWGTKSQSRGWQRADAQTCSFYVVLQGLNNVIRCVKLACVWDRNTWTPKWSSCVLLGLCTSRNELTRIGMCIYPYMGYTMYTKTICQT